MFHFVISSCLSDLVAKGKNGKLRHQATKFEEKFNQIHFKHNISYLNIIL